MITIHARIQVHRLNTFATLVFHMYYFVMAAQVFVDATEFAALVERNLHGIIEHCHYHLGQVAVVKKILMQGEHAV